MDQTLKTRSDNLIRTALPFIAQEGWTWPALIQGAIEGGYDEAILDLCFEGQVSQAVAHYSTMLDEEMVRKVSSLPLDTLKIRERIATCVLARLEAMNSHKEVAHRMLRYLALPSQILMASKLIYKTVNVMWYEAGDQTTDFSFYTKRVTLAAVYSSTLIYWMRDDSQDFKETRKFLERRLNDIMLIPRVKRKASQIIQALWRSPFQPDKHSREDDK